MNELDYASIGRRFLAIALDALILIVPCMVANHLIPVLGGILVVLAYSPVFESSATRATIGKYLMGIQVVNYSGERITFRAAVIRYFMKIVSSAILFLGHVLAFFTARKQALHDLIAETYVVYGREEISLADAWVEQIRGIFGTTPASRPPSQDNQDTPSAFRLAELERLQALREKGALTEEEFRQAKERLFQ